LPKKAHKKTRPRKDKKIFSILKTKQKNKLTKNLASKNKQKKQVRKKLIFYMPKNLAKKTRLAKENTKNKFEIKNKIV
jgi:hypothetical protein